MADSDGLENRCPERDRGFESHPLRQHIISQLIKCGARNSTNLQKKEGGIRTEALKGILPLHGVTGAMRRHEGAWPPSGSAGLARPARLRIPTLSASLREGYGWQASTVKDAKAVRRSLAANNRSLSLLSL